MFRMNPRQILVPVMGGVLPTIALYVGFGAIDNHNILFRIWSGAWGLIGFALMFPASPWYADENARRARERGSTK